MKNLKILFYTFGTATFILFLFIRYNNIVNGYLFFIPLVVTIAVLILISILCLLERLSIKNFIYEWIFLFSLVAIALLLIKFL